MPFKKGETPAGAKPFKKGQSGNPKGPPRKLFSHFIAEMKAKGVTVPSAVEIIDTSTMLMNMTTEELSAIASSKGVYEKAVVDGKEVIVFIKNKQQYPHGVRIIAETLLSKRKFEAMQTLQDRAHGRATQAVNLNGKVEVSALNKEISFLVLPSDVPVASLIESPKEKKKE